MRVAALIPAYQAAAHLGEVLIGIRALPDAPDVLVVDDGSRDATADVARQFGARVVSFAGNRGKGHALLEGFRLLSGYDGVVTLDADGQHPPECLPAFVTAAREADLVLGRRARTPDMPAGRRFANAFSSGWTAWLAGQPVSDSQCGYRLYRREVFMQTPITPGRYELESEFIVRAARLGFRVAEVEIPTVYGEEKSQIRTFRDVPRIFGTLARLTFERYAPPRAMREAGVSRSRA
jgi:UDP-N-acetylglucosamine---dolichyl-phosphate N-acetylglucosaminyltransferase